MFFKLKYVLELTLISLAFITTCSFSIILNSKPKFTLINSTANDVDKIKDDQFYIKSYRLVELECIADFPIKISVLGIRFNWIEYTKREVVIYNSARNYPFRASIGFYSNPEATGMYTCSYLTNNSTGNKNKNSNKSLISSLYIFAHDAGKKPEKILTNSLNQEKITTLKTNTEILIPCVTSNPYLKPKLYKYNDDSFPLQKTLDLAENTYTFEPSQGFLVNATKDNNYFATYVCSVNQNQDNVSYQVEIPDFKVNVAKTEITMFPREVVSFQCESFHPTKINLIFDNTRREGKNSQNASSFYKYVAVYKIIAPKTRFLKAFVKCEYNVTGHKTVFHQWTVYIGNISQSVQLPVFNPSVYSAVGFNRENNLFYCSVGKEFTATTTSINCSNLVNCETVQRFDPHTYGSQLPFNWSRGFLAQRDLKKELKLDLHNECAVIRPTPNARLGIIQCSIANKTFSETDKSNSFQSVRVLMQYYLDLNNQIVTETNKSDVQLKDVLQFKQLKDLKKTEVYFQETMNITCQASAFLFAKGMKLIFKLKNNKTTISEDPPDAAFKLAHSSDSHTVTITQEVRFWSMNIVSIWCSAYDWEAHTWKTIEEQILVKESQFPEFVDSENYNCTNIADKNRVNIEVTLHDKKNISCSATGIPLPNITWNRQDVLTHELTNFYTRKPRIGKMLDVKIVTSTIFFSNITTGHEYICTAMNVLGQAKRIFHFKVKLKSDDAISGNSHWIFSTVVGVCSVMLLIFLLVVIVLCRTLKSKQNEIEKLTEAEIDNFNYGNQDLVQRYEELNDVAQYLPYKQQYEIHPSKIEFKNDVLGSGDFGMVLKGVLEKSDKKFAVAVKTVKSGTNIRHLKSLLSEIKIMMYIGKHPHIIEMLGAITRELKNGKLYVIVELCSNGSLQNYLRSSRPTFLNQIVNDEIRTNPNRSISRQSSRRPKSRFLGIEDAITTAIEKTRSRYSSTVPVIKTTNLITWCYEVATGMEFLASKKVVHGDLATRNLLITDNLTVKITDFGLSRHLYAYSDYVKKQKTEPLPWRWLSIEGIQDSKFSTESDVWAYGITLWEIFSLAETPYQGFSWGEEFVKELCKGYRLGKPQYANNELHNTMKECWNAAPKDRPTFTDIAYNFKEMLQSINCRIKG